MDVSGNKVSFAIPFVRLPIVILHPLVAKSWSLRTIFNLPQSFLLTVVAHVLFTMDACHEGIDKTAKARATQSNEAPCGVLS